MAKKFWTGLKKPAAKIKMEEKEVTLQDIENKFSQALFDLGNHHYQRTMVQDELTRLNDLINTKKQFLDKCGKEARALKQKIEAEVHATAAKGQQQGITDALVDPDFQPEAAQ